MAALHVRIQLLEAAGLHASHLSLMTGEEKTFELRAANSNPWSSIMMRQASIWPGLTGLLLRPGNLRLRVLRISFGNLSDSPLVDRWFTKRVQKNFYSFPSTKLCKESCNTARRNVLGNLDLRGNLTVS
jgi:hypothetical protein